MSTDPFKNHDPGDYLQKIQEFQSFWQKIYIYMTIQSKNRSEPVIPDFGTGSGRSRTWIRNPG